MRYSLLLALLLTSTFTFAQHVITGKVVSMVNKQPMADASVFLSNSSVGTKTDADGTFSLYNVKGGQYDLVVTHIGYESAHQSVMVNANMELKTIELMPKVTELKEVKVKYDPSRARYLAIFKREFIGTSDNAKDCILKNPDVLDFEYDKRNSILKASTDDFLEIENRALGYTMKYLLVEYRHDARNGAIFYAGSSVFTPMKGKPSEEKRWERKRIAAYLGSSKHFLRSALSVTIPEEGFTVRRLIRSKNPDRPPDSLINVKLRQWRLAISPANPYPDSLTYWSKEYNKPKIIRTLITNPLNPTEFIKLTDKKDVFAFGYKDCLQISYKNKDNYTSVVEFHVPFAYFDLNGIVMNPKSHTMEGYWASLRIAELLPVDYVLPEGSKGN